MSEVLRVGSSINIRDVSYAVIGIDHYRLSNILGEVKGWESYTLQAEAGSKIWLARGINERDIIWESVHSNDIPSNASLTFNPGLSGIAQIEFEGDQGFSTPLSAIFWFDNPGGRYNFFVYERFLIPERTAQESETYFFTGTLR